MKNQLKLRVGVFAVAILASLATPQVARAEESSSAPSSQTSSIFAPSTQDADIYNLDFFRGCRSAGGSIADCVRGAKEHG